MDEDEDGWGDGWGDFEDRRGWEVNHVMPTWTTMPWNLCPPPPNASAVHSACLNNKPGNRGRRKARQPANSAPCVFGTSPNLAAVFVSKKLRHAIGIPSPVAPANCVLALVFCVLFVCSFACLLACLLVCLFDCLSQGPSSLQGPDAINQTLANAAMLPTGCTG